MHKHPMGCETQLAWKCLFKHDLWVYDFDP